MSKRKLLSIIIVGLFLSNCYQGEIDALKKQNNNLLLGLVNVSQSKATTTSSFALDGIAYTGLAGAVMEKFVGNQLRATWYNATFFRANSTGAYISIIPEYDNTEKSFYVVRGLVNYAEAGCPIAGAATAVPYTNCASGTYGGELKQDWSKVEYYRYRYTDDQADGNFYMCVEAGPYDSLAKAKADTTKSVFNFANLAQEITASTTCRDQDGSNTGSTTPAAGRVRVNIFDGFWFQLKKIK